MNAHQVASAVNRLVIAKGIVRREARQQSYTRLRAILREGNLSTVEQLWEVVQARLARTAKRREDAAIVGRELPAAVNPGYVQRSLLGNFDPAEGDMGGLPHSGLAECACEECDEARYQAGLGYIDNLA